ncbi:gephyrin-like molybdotransferase Glp [Fodinicurvata sp. EGI_FJ10296]|uniref:molybdopterin molybdotransferase MoeA n=1 Tax=Fodinicurvata sp. EGI_FJ10296 TaxID=3231908 RepID=UPI003454A07E
MVICPPAIDPADEMSGPRAVPQDDCTGASGPQNRLMPFDDALATGLGLAARPVPMETVALSDAVGRVLAGRACAGSPMPAFDHAAMDGYAVRYSDLAGPGPWTLELNGRAAAGDAPLPADAVATGAAVRILTGAPIPAGLDTVIMQEHAARSGNRVTIADRPRQGANIRLTGEDAAIGATVVAEGTLLGVREIAALASIGEAAVDVRRKLRIAWFSSGSELREPGEPLAPGQIHDANRYTLLAALDQPWIDRLDLGTVPDTPRALTDALIDASHRADMVVSTGGVSVGDEDHMPSVFREAGGDIRAMRIAMKPGKPLAIGRMNDAVYLGLPGNPVAAFVGWLTIGAPMARLMAGFADVRPPRHFARLAAASSRRPGRREFRPARITGRDDNGVPRIELLGSSFSARIGLLCAADGLAVLPADAETLDADTVVEFIWL